MSQYPAYDYATTYESVPLARHYSQASLVQPSVSVRSTSVAPIQRSRSVVTHTYHQSTPVVLQQQPVQTTTLVLPSNPVTLGLKAQATHFLQESAGRYMQNQESILQAMKLTMESLKQLDESMQQNMEKLQENFKRNQEALGKKMQADTKAIKENIESRKQQLQKRMEKLSELNQEAQKKYFESQENTITLYKKTMQKALQ